MTMATKCLHNKQNRVDAVALKAPKMSSRKCFITILSAVSFVIRNVQSIDCHKEGTFTKVEAGTDEINVFIDSVEFFDFFSTNFVLTLY